MELTIEHLAPYLPYGLEFENCGEYYTLLQLNIYYDQKPMQVNGYSFETGDMVDCFLEGCKPLLRPLSQLTEEIEQNGEKLVPESELHSKAFELGGDQYAEIVPHIINKDVEIEEYPHWMVQRLISWNFDVFGLIDNELAIKKQ